VIELAITSIKRVRDGNGEHPRDLQAGVRRRPDRSFSSKFDTISIARREAVAALDAFIGPKS
jgi:hypothetical protein